MAYSNENGEMDIKRVIYLNDETCINNVVETHNEIVKKLRNLGEPVV